jgi:hypothetical protein
MDWRQTDSAVNPNKSGESESMNDQPNAAPRTLSRSETHDLSMIIKDRTKVLRAHAEAQAGACLADFEKQLSTIYTWDQDEIWQKAHGRAEEVARECQAKIAERCKELGIPRTFAPDISLSWHGRGENAMTARRVELRRVAKSAIEAMKLAAITKIEKQSLELRTQVVAMGLLSPDAKMFLESLAPVDDAMRSLDFAEVEKRLEQENAELKRLRSRYG